MAARKAPLLYVYASAFLLSTCPADACILGIEKAPYLFRYGALAHPLLNFYAAISQHIQFTFPSVACQ